MGIHSGNNLFSTKYTFSIQATKKITILNFDFIGIKNKILATFQERDYEARPSCTH